MARLIPEDCRTKYSDVSSVADAEKAATPKLKSPKKQVTHEVTLKKDKDEDGYGFHLAYSNSFMGEDDSAGGHVIHWVGKGGPADIAGIRDGDRIICVSLTFYLCLPLFQFLIHFP